MKKKLKDKQLEWLELITTTHIQWLQGKWNWQVLTTLEHIKSTGEYDKLDQPILNEIRFEWYREFRRDGVKG